MVLLPVMVLCFLCFFVAKINPTKFWGANQVLHLPFARRSTHPQRSPHKLVHRLPAAPRPRRDTQSTSTQTLSLRLPATRLCSTKQPCRFFRATSQHRFLTIDPSS